MSFVNRDYPSKILLFGEYSVLCGSKALAFSYAYFKGKTLNLNQKHSYLNHLTGLATYLTAYFERNKLDPFIDVEGFQKALSENWFFDSNIPIGYGLGSSGALCAAVYTDFRKGECPNDSVLRERLSVLENYFHTTSSGMDPFVSYKERGYLLKDGKLEAVRDCGEKMRQIETETEMSFFLMDTNVSRQASPFINLFTGNLNRKDFRDFMETEYKVVNDACIDTFLSGASQSFYSSFYRLCELQQTVFSEMFMPEVRELGRALLSQKKGGIKLCGAGGGGYYLVSYLGSEAELRAEIPYSVHKIRGEYIK